MNQKTADMYKYILDGITLSDYQVGDKLPTELELCRQFNTGRMNAHFALKMLEKNNIVRRNKRSGTVVHRVPDNFEYGRLLANISRRVCILSHSPVHIQHLHWNAAIEESLKSELADEDIEIIYRNVGCLKTEEEYSQLLNELIAEGINILVIVSGGMDEYLSSHPDFLFKFHDQVVIFERGSLRWDEEAYHMVRINNFADGVQAAEYLFGQGFANLVFCQSSKSGYWQDERRRGLIQGNRRCTSGKGLVTILEFDDTGDSFPKIKGFAIVAANDKIAARLLESAQRRNLVMGEDFTLVSFDGDPVFADYHLTSFRPDYQEIGLQIANIIKHIIDGKHSNMRFCLRVQSKL